MEPCCRRQEASRGHLRCHRLSFLAASSFFRLGGYALFAGTPTVDLPLCRRLGCSLSRPPSCAPFQPHPRHTTVPPRPCRHPEFSSSLTSSLGSGHHFFVALFHHDSGPVASWESRALPAAAPCSPHLGELLGEPLRSLRLYQAPPPLAYSFAPPHRDELITSLPPDLVKLLHSSPHLAFT